MKNFLNKITIIMIIILHITFCNTRPLNKTTLSAQENNGDNYEFFDLYFSIKPFLIERKINCTIIWFCEKEVLGLNVEIKLPNGHGEIIYDSARHNSAAEYKTSQTANGTWRHELEMHISYWQIGTLELILNYSFTNKNLTEAKENNEPVYNRVYLLSENKWLDETKYEGLTYKIVITGLIISVISALATYIIIEHTKQENNHPILSEEEDIDINE